MTQKYKVMPRIMTKKDTYTFDYPSANESARKQGSIIWFAEELGVEKDEHDVRTKLSPGERHALVETSKLFTHYELKLGGVEFWGGKVAQMFPRPEIQRMAATFSFIELGVHAPFYNLINETLSIATDEFYNEWKHDPVLVERMDFIDHYADSDCPLRSMAAFAFMEGAVIFSNFAFIKSLNSGGFNMCPHFTAGIDASAKDENFHSMASAWLYNQTLKELEELGEINAEDIKILHEDIINIAKKVFEHESYIIDTLFSGGEIRTITKADMIEFVKNRIDTVLAYLGMPPLFGIPEGKVAGWFFNQLSTFKYSDFFSTQQIQYVRDWNKANLKFNVSAGE